MTIFFVRFFVDFNKKFPTQISVNYMQKLRFFCSIFCSFFLLIFNIVNIVNRVRETQKWHWIVDISYIFREKKTVNGSFRHEIDLSAINIVSRTLFNAIMFWICSYLVNFSRYWHKSICNNKLFRERERESCFATLVYQQDCKWGTRNSKITLACSYL